MYRFAPLRHVLAAVTAMAVGVLGHVVLGFVAPTPAAAAVSPVLDRPAAAVTADALPTVQIDTGIVWTQAISGNTVYAGGQFSNARPAGAAAGTSLTPRGNLLAYDVTTGKLTSFAPALNGTVKALTVSPDRRRLYVGGTFTTANGQNRSRIAAYDTATGALVSSFAPNLNGGVNAIAATDTTVYVGGVFGVANGANRSRLAAFRASDGALVSWGPTADFDVTSVVFTPDRSKVVVGGGFQNVNGTAAQGITALNAATGALVPWPVNQVIRNGNAQSGIYSLSVDRDTIYGSSYNYGTGNYEGQFAMKPDGTIKWLADCHGDTYSTFSADNGIVYGAGHPHHCANIGGFPELTPRKEQRLVAFTKAVTGEVQTNSQPGSGYGNFAGQPSPSLINYFPQFTVGTVSGASQAVWSLTGNTQYLAAAGEFPSVNGTPQRGLVRFAVSSIAPNKRGPVDLGGTTNPTVTPVAGYGARVTWKLNWDYDDTSLTYRVVRADRPTAPLHTTTQRSYYWRRPNVSFTDTTAQPGQTYRYRVTVADPNGNGTQSDYVSVTMPTGTLSTYGKAVLDDGATNYWRLGDAGSPTLADLAGGTTLTGLSGVTPATPGAVTGDEDGAATFSGTSSGVAGATTAVPGPTTFTAETWIRTTSTRGGKLLGFGDSSTGTSGSYDRHLYMNNAGRITFGVYPGAVRTLTTAGSYNDGAWHHVVAQVSSAGTSLWVDGVQQGSDPTTVSAQPYTGYWRLGGDNLGSWPNTGTSTFWAGQLDDTAIYPTALSQAQIRDHYAKSGRTGPANAAPTASFTADSCPAGSCGFDASASSDSDGSVASYAWDFGDQGTGSGGQAGHRYTRSGTYAVRLTVTDDQGATATVARDVTVTVPNQRPSADLAVSCTGLTCEADGSASRDPDGSVASYAWDYGDDATGTGRTSSHTYSAPGTYAVQLEVTDDQGATDTATRTVTVSSANVAPAASFTAGCSDLTCDLDGSASSDPDGTVASYAWDFGDDATGTGRTTSHTFDAAGSYPVELTVTDDDGATDTQTKTVTVTAPGPAAVAADEFSRTVTRWGSADTGGAWTLAGPTAFSTNGRAGLIRLASAGSSATASLDSVSAANVDLRADLAVDKVVSGNGAYANLVTRRNGSTFYTMKVRFLSNGSVNVAASRTVGGTETNLREVAVSGLGYAAGDVLRARFTVTGSSPATVAAKVWRASGSEPANPQVSVTDATAALQSAGGVGVSTYLSGSSTSAPVTVSVDDVLAVRL